MAPYLHQQNNPQAVKGENLAHGEVLALLSPRERNTEVSPPLVQPKLKQRSREGFIDRHEANVWLRPRNSIRRIGVLLGREEPTRTHKEASRCSGANQKPRSQCLVQTLPRGLILAFSEHTWHVQTVRWMKPSTCFTRFHITEGTDRLGEVDHSFKTKTVYYLNDRHKVCQVLQYLN